MKEITVDIDSDIREILKQGHTDENIYFLPTIQLSREDYVKVNKVLEISGGKWNRGKKGHVFASNEAAKAMIRIADQENVVDKKKTYQFFETPKEVAEQMVELADIRDEMMVLEPSAGHGAIAEAIARYDIEKPIYNVGLILVDIDPEKCEVLEEKKIAPVVCADFLGTFADEYGKFDRIIMNPPFTKGQDAEHVFHAYSKCLENGGRLVSVMSGSIKFNQQKKYQKVRELIEKNGEIIDLPEFSFKESGTNVNTVIVILNK